jgi:predicted transcriptional regulator
VEEVRAFIANHVGMSNRKVAAALGILETTIRRLLKKDVKETASFTISGL